MDAAAETAIRAGDDIFASHHLGEGQDAVGDELGVLDDIGGVADDTGDLDLAVGQFDVLPDPPLMCVTNIAGFDRERADAHLQ